MKIELPADIKMYCVYMPNTYTGEIAFAHTIYEAIQEALPLIQERVKGRVLRWQDLSAYLIDEVE